MNEAPVFLTPEGRSKLQEELHYLCTVRRPEVADQIRVAKGHGDISENSGYEEAKNAQAFVEGRILTLEAMLKNARIIQKDGPVDCVELGATVTVQEDGSEPETFTIVGSAEIDPLGGRISNESPIGRALLGRKTGDEVFVDTPGGSFRLRIMAVD